MKLQHINIIELTWLSDWVTSQSCCVLLRLAESSCNPTHNRFRWVRINWQYKIGGRNGCCFFFLLPNLISTLFYQFTVALIVFKKIKWKSWLILAWSCWRMFSHRGCRIPTRLTLTSSSFGLSSALSTFYQLCPRPPFQVGLGTDHECPGKSSGGAETTVPT